VFVLVDILGPIIGAVRFLLGLMTIMIIIRAVVSFFTISPWNPWVRFLVAVTEPALRPIRRFHPYIAGFDLSPLIAVVLLGVLNDILGGLNADLYRLR